MIIHLTNNKPSESIFFIDESKKNLRIVSLSVFNKERHSDKIILQIFSSLKCKKQETELVDELNLPSFKTILPGRDFVEQFVNLRYRIPPGCEKITFAVKSKELFEVECKIGMD